jgi:hypothetical protein
VQHSNKNQKYFKIRYVVKEQSQQPFGTTVKSIFLGFIITVFLCSLVSSSNTPVEIQQQNPAQHFLVPLQNNHLVFVAVEKTKRQENISSDNSSLSYALCVHQRHVRRAAQICRITAIEILPSYISNLLYTQTTSSFL